MSISYRQAHLYLFLIYFLINGNRIFLDKSTYGFIFSSKSRYGFFDKPSQIYQNRRKFIKESAHKFHTRVRVKFCEGIR